MLYDVHFYQTEAKRNPDWMKPFLRPPPVVPLEKRRAFRNVAALADFLKEQKGKEFTSPMVMEYFMARGWHATRPKQNAATFLTLLAKRGKMIRVVSGNARSKRYVAKAESGKAEKAACRAVAQRRREMLNRQDAKNAENYQPSTFNYQPIK